MAKSDKPRLLKDSSALIALIKNEPGAEGLDGLLNLIDSGEVELVESVLVLGEVYKRSDAKDEAARRRHDEKLDNIRFLLESPAVLLLDVTPPIVKKATEYRLNKAPKNLPDAVHLATAVLNGCDWLVTFDADFPEVEGLRTFDGAISEIPIPSFHGPWRCKTRCSRSRSRSFNPGILSNRRHRHESAAAVRSPVGWVVVLLTRRGMARLRFFDVALRVNAAPRSTETSPRGAAG